MIAPTLTVLRVREDWNMKNVAVFRPPAVFWAVWLDMPKVGLTALFAWNELSLETQTANVE